MYSMKWNGAFVLKSPLSLSLSFFILEIFSVFFFNSNFFALKEHYECVRGWEKEIAAFQQPFYTDQFYGLLCCLWAL